MAIFFNYIIMFTKGKRQLVPVVLQLMYHVMKS